MLIKGLLARGLDPRPSLQSGARIGFGEHAGCGIPTTLLSFAFAIFLVCRPVRAA